MEYKYVIKKAKLAPPPGCDWDNPAWRGAETAILGYSTFTKNDHRPLTQVRLLYDDGGIHGIFRVEDNYVRVVHTGYQASVCLDSCVEFFVRPRSDKGYFNFEMNGGGALLCYYITDPRRVPDGFAEFVKLPEELLRRVPVAHTLPETVEPEFARPTVWCNRFFVPFAVLEAYLGPLPHPAGETWRCNFFKCADQCSHPHWLTWSPVTELNFHLPECFGTLEFER